MCRCELEKNATDLRDVVCRCELEKNATDLRDVVCRCELEQNATDLRDVVCRCELEQRTADGGELFATIRWPPEARRQHIQWMVLFGTYTKPT